MKWTIGIVLGFVASVSWAGDNCYIHDYGSESWIACKEQARGNDQRQADLDNRLQGIMDETSQAVSTKLQIEQVLQERYDGTLRAEPVRVIDKQR